MRPIAVALAVVVAAALVAPASRADAAFSDMICPEATQYVVGLTGMKTSDPPQRIYDAVHATTAAYATCAGRHLANANVEPGFNYASTREASFGILEARALLRLNRAAEGKQVLLTSRRLAQAVVDWRFSADPRDERLSLYHAAAKEVLDAAAALLAQVDAPAPAASGAPAPP